MFGNFLKKRLRIWIEFQEFRKNVDHPFEVDIQPIFEFDVYKYSLELDDEIIFSNLYHQPISEAQLKKAASICGKDILTQIKKKK